MPGDQEIQFEYRQMLTYSFGQLKNLARKDKRRKE